jgi:uncharacterized membrane protein
MTLDRSHRRKIMKDLLLGHTIDPADEPFARDKAERVSSRLPHGLLSGLAFGFMLVGGAPSLFPPTPLTMTLLVLGVLSAVVYLTGLTFAIRLWWWLRLHP